MIFDNIPREKKGNLGKQSNKDPIFILDGKRKEEKQYNPVEKKKTSFGNSR